MRGPDDDFKNDDGVMKCIRIEGTNDELKNEEL